MLCFFIDIFSLLFFSWMFMNFGHFAMSSTKNYFVQFFFGPSSFVLHAFVTIFIGFLPLALSTIHDFSPNPNIEIILCLYVARGFCSVARTRICNSNWAKYSPNIRNRSCNETQNNICRRWNWCNLIFSSFLGFRIWWHMFRFFSLSS